MSPSTMYLSIIRALSLVFENESDKELSIVAETVDVCFVTGIRKSVAILDFCV